MKIILLHGDHEVKARDRLIQFIEVAKSRGWEVINTSDTDQNVTEVISAQGLFAKEKLVISEDVKEFTKKRTEWIERKRKELGSNLVIIHKRILNKTAIKKLPKPDKIEEFVYPKEIWVFIDSLIPGNARNSLNLLASVMEKEPPEIVFAVIAKHFRDMYWSKKDFSGMPYPGWRKSKIKAKANKFEDDQLFGMFQMLADIDLKTKTSKAEMKAELEFFIATELK